MDTDDRLVTLDGFCEAMSITPRTYRNWRVKGDVPPSVKIGRRVLFRPDAVKAWIEQRETTAKAA